MTKSDAIHKAILAAEKVFMAAYNRHDAPALAALYTRDGEIMPPNSGVVKGARKLQALFKSFWDAGDTVIKLDTVEAKGFGDTAYEVGKYTLSGDSGKVNDRDKYIVIWRKVGGQWKLYRDIFNTSVPEKK
ncbi:MAG: YybH family protein [Reyranella sp.]